MGKKEPFGVKPPAVYYSTILLVVIIRSVIIMRRTPIWTLQFDDNAWLRDAFQLLVRILQCSRRCRWRCFVMHVLRRTIHRPVYCHAQHCASDILCSLCTK